MEVDLEAAKKGLTFAIEYAQLVVGVVVGAIGLLAYQKKYKPVTVNDLNIAKEMARLTEQLRHSTEAHKNCIDKLAPLQAIADELLKEKLKR